MRRRPPGTSTHHLLLSILTLFALSPASSWAAANTRPKNAVLLSEVQSLTLTHGKKTTSRRVPSIPQLKCVSNPTSLCRLPNAQISTMRCVNQGSSYTSEDIEWACSAALPSTLRLERTEVICEGYESPDDPYVLRGSCGVEYSLGLTEEGMRRYPHLAKKAREVDWSGVLFGILFVGVLAWIVYGACVGARQNGQPRPRRRGGNGWGGGGGGWWPGGGGGGRWDDPPPPYPGTKPAEEPWRPGFWSGLASGAAAGYMAGNRGQRGDRYGNYGRGGGIWGDNGGSSWGSGSGSWGSGSGGSSSSGSSGSNTRYESTGYGSTSRR